MVASGRWLFFFFFWNLHRGALTRRGRGLGPRSPPVHALREPCVSSIDRFPLDVCVAPVLLLGLLRKRGRREERGGEK